METTITDLPTASGIDAAADWFAIDRTSLNTTQKINRNTMLGIAGAPVGTTDSQTLTNKVITSPTITVLDNALTIQDNVDPTKQAQFQLSGITAGQTRTLTVPDANTTIVGTDATQTLTNKTLTAPVIVNGSITGTTITTDAIVGQSVATNGTVYGLTITGGKVGTNGVVTNSITNSAVDYTKVAAGFVVQVVNFQTGTLATGTTVLPFDNTIPQITEGDQYMTLSITPKSATNVLIIDVVAELGIPNVQQNIGGALFQDATANALAVTNLGNTAAVSNSATMVLKHKMTAGTTSPTTFRFRAGVQVSGTLTFNGIGGAAFFGDTYASSITITEYKV